MAAITNAAPRNTRNSTLEFDLVGKSAVLVRRRLRINIRKRSRNELALEDVEAFATLDTA
jgi:hypothetical protein